MDVSRWLAAAALGAALGGCGGSHRSVDRDSSSMRPPRVVAPPASGLVLPASQAGPTTCTVYDSGYGTQVIFDSQSLNVSGECQAWISREPGAGYLWAYQPTSAAIDTTAVSVCDLRDPSGRVTATVIEDTGFAPLSAVQRKKTTTACTSLAAAGWARLARAAR